jgi:hypothetical protein
VGSIIGSATSAGERLNGVVSALRSGNAVLLLPRQLEAGLQTFSGDIAALPAALTGPQRGLPGGLMPAAASTSLATIEGPYQTLFAKTAANLQALDAVWSANPAPHAHQFVNNQIGYAQTIAGGLQTFIQGLPAEWADLPANIHSALQALVTFNPVPYLQQLINNQIAYAQIISTSLQMLPTTSARVCSPCLVHSNRPSRPSWPATSAAR